MADFGYCRSTSSFLLVIYDHVDSLLATVYFIGLAAAMILYFDRRFGVLALLGALMVALSEWCDSADRLLLHIQHRTSHFTLPQGYQVMDTVQYTMSHCGMLTLTLGLVLSISVRNTYSSIAANESGTLAVSDETKKHTTPEIIQAVLMIKHQLHIQKTRHRQQQYAWWKQPQHLLPPRSYMIWYIVLPSVLYVCILLFGLANVLLEQLVIHAVEERALVGVELLDAMFLVRIVGEYVQIIIRVLCGSVILTLISGQIVAMGFIRKQRMWRMITLASIALLVAGLLLCFITMAMTIAEYYSDEMVTLNGSCEWNLYIKESISSLGYLCNTLAILWFFILLQSERRKTCEAAADGSDSSMMDPLSRSYAQELQTTNTKGMRSNPQVAMIEHELMKLEDEFFEQ